MNMTIVGQQGYLLKVDKVSDSVSIGDVLSSSNGVLVEVVYVDRVECEVGFLPKES